MDDHSAPETSHSNFLLSIVGAVGSMLLFGLIIYIAYVPNRPGPVDEDIVQNRMTNLKEVNSAATKAADNYAWVNEKEGIVRIPVSQAMQLAAQRLGAGEPVLGNSSKTPAKPAQDASPSAKESSISPGQK